MRYRPFMILPAGGDSGRSMAPVWPVVLEGLTLVAAEGFL